MPRTYKRKPGSRRYKDYSEETLLKAVEECKMIPMKDVSQIYNIPIRTLRNKANKLHSLKAGGQTALSEETESTLLQYVLSCADYGMPLTKEDIQFLTKGLLDKLGITVPKFDNNMPGRDWAMAFLKRHKEELCTRNCPNIKRTRAEVGRELIEEYFNNLSVSLQDVPPSNILNYDETNLADEPGVKKCVFRRGVKYPERVINYSKGNISVMFCGTATGELLPPYVIYKAEGLWNTWCYGGPKGTRFGRSKSGWMDSENFQEWFMTIVVPWARRKEGRKLIVGDNLSSHLSSTVIDKCKEFDIVFVLLPPNSTDKCQPLDVSFFAPLKKEWRRLLEDYRQKNPSSSSLDKAKFPSMLNKLIEAMGMRSEANLISGFRVACGIVPFNPQHVLKKLPSQSAVSESKDHSVVSEAVLEYLQQFKYSPNGHKQGATQKRKKVSVAPGKSLTAEDLQLSAPPAPGPPSTSSTPGPSSTSPTPGPSSGPSSALAKSRPRLHFRDRESIPDEDSSDSWMSQYSSEDEEWVPPTKKSK